MTTVDVLLFAFRIAACLLSVFKLPVFVKFPSTRVGGSQRKVVTWYYLHQCLPIPMAGP